MMNDSELIQRSLGQASTLITSKQTQENLK